MPHVAENQHILDHLNAERNERHIGNDLRDRCVCDNATGDGPCEKPSVDYVPIPCCMDESCDKYAELPVCAFHFDEYWADDEE